MRDLGIENGCTECKGGAAGGGAARDIPNGRKSFGHFELCRRGVPLRVGLFSLGHQECRTRATELCSSLRVVLLNRVARGAGHEPTFHLIFRGSGNLVYPFTEHCQPVERPLSGRASTGGST